MASIFKKDDNFVDKPNRNSFDMSWQNNLTTKFGKLVPCYCQEVIPGDSFKITPTFGLRFLPQVFPVQTRMKAHIHFFYVRNRTIWKEWMDFIGKTKTGLTLPYLKSSITESNKFDGDSSLTPSSIYDYMGLPVVLDSEVQPTTFRVFSSRGDISSVLIGNNQVNELSAETPSKFNLTTEQISSDNNYSIDSDASTYCVYRELTTPVNVVDKPHINYPKIACSGQSQLGYNVKAYALCEVVEVNDSNHVFKALVNVGTLNNVGSSFLIDSSVNIHASLSSVQSSYLNCYIKRIIGTVYYNLDGQYDANFYRGSSLVYEVIPSVNRNYPLSSLSRNSLPYGDSPLQMRISALPFRAYEAVYNSFYRNAENNPFIVDGVAEYNRYVKSMDGGAQSMDDFSLFNRNWEDDAFTTALPTPQQTLDANGAPRVGLTGTPNQPVEVHFYDEDGNTQKVLLQVNESGRVGMVLAGEGVSSDLVAGLNAAANFGITINDLRNVNALTLWLEKNIRRGFKYPDQMMSHYGVKVEFNELMMPEFIGGISRDVTVNQISQTVETDSGNLGDMAGQAYVVGEGHSIQRYCDEHGYIIGIMSVVPVPNYSQLIPKHFFKHDTFDYFFPEFGHIGMQPITCKEIAATASWLSERGDEVFGYQRAWYDYLARVDEVHGKFNGEFYNYLIQRKFGNVPELGKNFTTIINSDLNNIFYVDDGEDKILGQIYFDVKAIRPIPLFGIPSLT